MLKFLFGKTTETKKPTETTLETKHGPVRANRVALPGGAVAYVCHTATKPQNVALDVDRVEFVSTDRNNGESHDTNNMMSEANDDGSKSDFQFYAENLCNTYANLDQAVVVVFFDPRPNALSSTQVLQEVRKTFPATNPAQDRLAHNPAADQNNNKTPCPNVATSPASYTCYPMCG